MEKAKLYLWLTATAGYLGFGMVFGHSIGNSTTDTELWVGGILIFLAAVTFGMYVSTKAAKPGSRPEKKPETEKK